MQAGKYKSTMRANEYKILCECVERGAQWGYRKAHKHTDNPSSETICSSVADAILLEISEYFEFDSELLNEDER